ncbi:MAG: D-cysteine desulfhydrase family protein [Pseudomonadota bacterium]
MENLLENRFHLAHLPTPIQFMPRLSDELGVKLYIKRDDLTESIGSGNKIRKLEYLLHDAIRKKADTLVSCGGIQSNHCRAVAWASAKTGLSCVLALRGEKPADIDGNLLLDRILGADTRFFSVQDFKDISAVEKTVMGELIQNGKRPYWIPMGGSNATGTLGYVQMIRELATSAVSFDHLYLALGSGGTFAGVFLGCRHAKIQTQIHGIAVCDDTAYFMAEISRIQREFQDWYGMKVDFKGADQLIDDHHVGIGYAINTDQELKQLVRFASIEGLVLDPVYTLKAFLGMVNHIRSGKIEKGGTVLFVHTGGHSGLFPKHPEFRQMFS